MKKKLRNGGMNRTGFDWGVCPGKVVAAKHLHQQQTSPNCRPPPVRLRPPRPDPNVAPQPLRHPTGCQVLIRRTAPGPHDDNPRYARAHLSFFRPSLQCPPRAHKGRLFPERLVKPRKIWPIETMPSSCYGRTRVSNLNSNEILSMTHTLEPIVRNV